MSTNEVSFLNDSGLWAHHAYGIEGNPETSVSWLQAQLALGPDLSIYKDEQCDIELVRTVRSRADETGFGKRRAFIISGYRYTSEAQNALLKMTEDPIAGTAYFLVVPRNSHFIPTLRSRLHVVAAPKENRFSKETEAFLTASVPERLKIVEKLLEGHDEHGEKRLVAEKLDQFTQELAESIRKARTSGGISPAEKEILFVREYIYDTAASLRLLGEHLAISVG